MHWFRLVFLIAFPVLSLAGALTDTQTFTVSALGCLVLAICWHQALQYPAAFLLLFIALIATVWYVPLASKVIFTAVPVIFILLTAGLFASTLRQGKTPLVSAVASIIRNEELAPEIASYGRVVTQLWVVGLIGLAIANIVVAIVGSVSTWSFMINVGNYIFLLLFFILELIARYIVLRKFKHPSIDTFIKGLAKIDYGELLK